MKHDPSDSADDPFARIRQAAQDAPPALAAVAQWMLRNSAQAATVSIQEIAAAAGSSPASVNRLSRAAGYAGFSELKAALTHVMREAIDPVRKLRDEQHRSRLSPAAQYVAMGRANLEQLVRDNSEDTLAAAARMLSTRGRIYVLGFGLTVHVCGWLADALSPFSHSVTSLAGAGGTEQAASRMSNIGKGDVLVAMSLPRYSRATIQLARLARERGAQVLAIVDSQAAPLAGEADLSLFASSAHPVLPASYVALQLLVEALAGEVMRRNPKAVAHAAELTDSVASQLTLASDEAR